MSFLSRMTTETGTPMPRWLYLLLKPVETLAIGVAIANLTGLSQFSGTWLAATLYVGLGLWAWYRHRPIVWTSASQGQYWGDLAYHGILSLIAVGVVAPLEIWSRWILILLLTGMWWALDVNNYGPMRAP